MRPVLASKGGQGTYTYNLATNLGNFTFGFGGKNAKAAITLYGTKQPTYAECFDTWTYVAQFDNNQIATKKRKANLDEMRLIAGVVKDNKIGDLYRAAADPLYAQLGGFCSDRELPIDKVEVEHICPKAEYPVFCLAWENFLLACSFCNGKSAKSDRPSRAYVVKQYLKGTQPLNEKGYYDEIRQQYYWADSWSTTYQELLAELHYQDPTSKKWQPLDLALATKSGQRIYPANTVTREVYAEIWLKSTDTKTTKCLVQVLVDGPYAQADNTVELCQLNNDKAQKQDRRVLQRTQTWFEALAQLDALALLTTQQLFDTFWARALATAVSMGFYSVWVEVLNATQAKDPSGKLLVTRFVAETNTAGAYPNTNTTDVP